MIEKKEVIFGREDRISQFSNEIPLSDVIRITEIQFNHEECHYPEYVCILVNGKIVAEFGNY